MAFSPDGNWLYAGFGRDVKMIRVDTVTGKTTDSATLRGHDSDVFDLAISPDGVWLLVATGKGTIQPWKLQSEPVVGGTKADAFTFAESETNPIRDVEFAPGGTFAVSNARGNGAVVWAVDGATEAATRRLFVFGLRIENCGTDTNIWARDCAGPGQRAAANSAMAASWAAQIWPMISASCAALTNQAS